MLRMACVLLVMVVAGCSSAGSASPPAAGSSNKYLQTWTKPQNETLCADYNDVMTPTQRLAMAASLLLFFQQKDRNSTDPNVVPMPADSLIEAFHASIAAGCHDLPANTVFATAGNAYGKNHSQYGPSASP
jgi:hypothetical protein